MDLIDVRNTYSLNLHVHSCNVKQFITKHYITFNHLTDPRAFIKPISTYRGFPSFLILGENKLIYLLMDFDV